MVYSGQNAPSRIQNPFPFHFFKYCDELLFLSGIELFQIDFCVLRIAEMVILSWSFEFHKSVAITSHQFFSKFDEGEHLSDIIPLNNHADSEKHQVVQAPYELEVVHQPVPIAWGADFGVGLWAGGINGNVSGEVQSMYSLHFHVHLLIEQLPIGMKMDSSDVRIPGTVEIYQEVAEHPAHERIAHTGKCNGRHGGQYLFLHVAVKVAYFVELVFSQMDEVMPA